MWLRLILFTYGNNSVHLCIAYIHKQYIFLGWRLTCVFWRLENWAGVFVERTRCAGRKKAQKELQTLAWTLTARGIFHAAEECRSGSQSPTTEWGHFTMCSSGLASFVRSLLFRGGRERLTVTVTQSFFCVGRRLSLLVSWGGRCGAQESLWRPWARNYQLSSE